MSSLLLQGELNLEFLIFKKEEQQESCYLNKVFTLCVFHQLLTIAKII